MKIVKFTDMTIVKKEGGNRLIDFVLTDLNFYQSKLRDKIPTFASWIQMTSHF